MINKSKNLYNSIIKDISKIIKKHLDESFDFNQIKNNKNSTFNKNNIKTAKYYCRKLQAEEFIKNIENIGKKLKEKNLDLIPMIEFDYIDNDNQQDHIHVLFKYSNGTFVDFEEKYGSRPHYTLLDLDEDFFAREISKVFNMYDEQKIKQPMIGFLFGNIAAIKKIASLEKYKKHAYVKDGHIGVFPKVKTPEDNCKILLDFYTDLYNSEYGINE